MILSKIFQFVKDNQNDIILVIGVILISLLSFAAGFIVAKQQEKKPLYFEEETYYEESENSNYWSRNSGSLFGLEAFKEGA